MSAQRSRRPVIGLVGGIGSGKSAVAAELVKHGGWIINADRFGHDALCQPEIKRRVVERFGPGILDSQGDVDRKRLGQRVFADADELRALEGIVFPFITQRIHDEINQARQRDDVRFVILDAAVMLEAGWTGACDRLIFIEAPRNVRLERVQRQRGWSDADLQAREASQMPLEEKRRLADGIIDNAGTTENLAVQVEVLLRSWGLV